MTDTFTPMGTLKPRTVRAARDLRTGEKILSQNEMMTIHFVSFLPARVDRRAMEMLTRGRDIADAVVIEAKSDSGRMQRIEFDAGDIVPTY